MAKRHGFLLKDLALYLFLGSLLLASMLQLFRTGWISFQSIRRVQAVTADFISTSERIKYDLLGSIDELTVGKSSLTFTFLKFAENRVDFTSRDYSLQMSGSRLIYNIHNGTSYTAVYLSSLVQSISFEHEADLLTIIFDYGDYSFRRCYRLDHIKTQRFPYGFLPHPAPLLCRERGDHLPGFSAEPIRKQHLLV